MDELKLEEIKEAMIKEAKEVYGDISLPFRKTHRKDCFTHNGNVLYFWFNYKLANGFETTTAVKREVDDDITL